MVKIVLTSLEEIPFLKSLCISNLVTPECMFVSQMAQRKTPLKLRIGNSYVFFLSTISSFYFSLIHFAIQRLSFNKTNDASHH